MSQTVASKLKGYFISGFFTVIPIGLSALVIWWFVRMVDDTFSPVVAGAVGFHFPGLGLFLAIVAILLAGVLSSHVLGERIVDAADGLLQRVPVYKWVYGTVKQTMDAFSPGKQASFRSVVLVQYPRLGAYSMGFVTNEVALQKADGGTAEMLAVYVPTNHFYFGDIILFPKQEVVFTSLSIQQGIQAAFSAGAALPETLSKKSL